MKCRFCLVGLKWGLRVCISMPTKVRTVKSMVFPVDVYGCESWIIKEVEDQRIDAFKLWCCGRLLRVSWTARRSNQSILKEINPEYSLEGLMLKLQYLGHLMWRAASLENTLVLGKIEGKRMRQQRRSWLASISDSMDTSLSTLGDSKWKGSLVCYSPQGHKGSDMTEQLNNNKVQKPSVTDCSFRILSPRGLLIWVASSVKFGVC